MSIIKCAKEKVHYDQKYFVKEEEKHFRSQVKVPKIQEFAK